MHNWNEIKDAQLVSCSWAGVGASNWIKFCAYGISEMDIANWKEAIRPVYEDILGEVGEYRPLGSRSLRLSIGRHLKEVDGAPSLSLSYQATPRLHYRNSVRFRS